MNFARLALLTCFASGIAVPAAQAQLSHKPDAVLRHGFEDAASGPATDAEAARFLAQATFGPSSSEIARLRTLGYRAWLDDQFNQPVSTQVPYLNWTRDLPGTPQGNNDVNDETMLEAWTINALGTSDPSRSPPAQVTPTDQLRQRVAFALSEIFVVSNANGALSYQSWALASYYDMLARNALGNYRTLLEEVSLHPAMGIYLSHLQNRKEDLSQNVRPDENFAREILQLFSVGLVMLEPDGSVRDGNATTAGVQPIPSYGQATIRGVAKVFTGWNWNNQGCGAATYTCCNEETYDWCGPANRDDPPWRQPMQPVEAFHEVAAPKQLLDYSGVTLPGGVLSGGGNARADLAAALDNVFRHPNVGPFIARQLIQRLVTSNPTPAYVQRVAAAFANNGSGVRGDLRAVVRAVLLDPEARFGHWLAPDTFGKLREPLLKTTHLWRALGARAANGRAAGLRSWPYIEDQYGQGPLRATTVFNFFRPDYRPPGESVARKLDAPEFQILTDTTAVSQPNHVFALLFCHYVGSTRCWDSEDPSELQIDIAADETLASTDPARLIERYNLLFMSGQMSPFMRRVLLDRLNEVPAQVWSNEPLGRRRVQHALYLILTSPEYSVQK